MARTPPENASDRGKTFVVFHSFEEENHAEHLRRAAMSPEERCRELALLQERMWGERWTSIPIVKTATWETLEW